MALNLGPCYGPLGYVSGSETVVRMLLWFGKAYRAVRQLAAVEHGRGDRASRVRPRSVSHARSHRTRGAAASLALLFALAPSLASAQAVDSRTVPNGSPLSGSGTSNDGTSNTDQTTTGNGQNTTGSTVNTLPTIEPAQINTGRETLRPDTQQPLRFPTPTVKPPASPGEFEQYLRLLAGRDVKRFGSNLLLPSDRDFSVPATATIPPDYAVNIGDTIAINLTGSIEGSARFEVDTNGRIFLPKVGEISVVGVRNRDLLARISRAIGQQYRGYEVSVSIAKLRGIRVYVTGFANNPGAYTVSSLSTLINAVLAAGGPNAGGSFRMVQLYRNGRLQTEFDLYAMLRNGDRSRDPLLENEDVLFIPPVGGQVAVLGSVNEEAIYESRPGETIEQMLQYAGGPNALADPSRVVLYRLGDKETVGSRDVARVTAAQEIVAGGDIVQIVSKGSLAQPLERQFVLVRLEGEVNKPGNYFVAPNTPLSAVLERAGGLTPRAYVYGSRMFRDSVREQQRDSYREAIDQMENILASAPLVNTSGTDGAQRAAQFAAARTVLDRLRKAEPDGRMVLPIPYGATQLPNDLLLENNDRIIVPPVLRTIGVYGAVYRPASFLLSSAPMRVRDYVERSGGMTRTADRSNIFVIRANGEVLSRKRGAFNAMVQPGDLVFVPAKTQSYSFLAKLRDISAILFQLGLSVAAVAAVR